MDEKVNQKKRRIDNTEANQQRTHAVRDWYLRAGVTEAIDQDLDFM